MVLEAKAREILRGGYDLHVHASPSHSPRKLDDFELARQLDAYGMAGAITKSHYDATAGRAAIANRHSGAAAKLYGALALNRPVGGINPHAVDAAFRLGAKMIWLPTRDVKSGLGVTDDSGGLIGALYEVFDVVKAHHGWLATGHLKPEVSARVCREGLARGVNMILTHPDSKSTNVPVDVQVALAREGVMVEKAWGNVYNGYLSAAAMAESIRRIGPERVFLVTDYGQVDSPMPCEGMLAFVTAMLEQGLSEEELITMVRRNPARILGVGL